jgi:metal-responsive CopG/Arc/MetJ family transcriptional regulator
MKTAISIPDGVFEAAEKIAQQLGVSRSEFYTKALQAYLEKHSRSQRLAKLNEVYAQEASDVDPVMEKMQAMSLSHQDLAQEDW